MITLGQVQRVEPTTSSFDELGGYIKADTSRGIVIFDKAQLKPKKVLHCKSCGQVVSMKQMPARMYGKEIKQWYKMNDDGSIHCCEARYLFEDDKNWSDDL